MSRREILAPCCYRQDAKAKYLDEESELLAKIRELAMGKKLALIERTIPDQPNSRMQKYRLTKMGKAKWRELK